LVFNLEIVYLYDSIIFSVALYLILCFYRPAKLKNYKLKAIIIMIQKEMESGPSEPKKYIKRSFPSENSKFSVMSQPETALVFDAAKIIHRFREFKEVQHEQLAGINLPEELKVHLFGFSPSHYLLNRTNLSDLIIENHPLDGRIIMAK
jgi:hypothetical protein